LTVFWEVKFIELKDGEIFGINGIGKFLDFGSRETIRTWLGVITVVLQIVILIQVMGD